MFKHVTFDKDSLVMCHFNTLRAYLKQFLRKKEVGCIDNLLWKINVEDLKKMSRLMS